MNGKLLIVEDEPIVALDLQQEVEELGFEVTGLAESADEALLAVEETRPDLALMDVRIVGSMDGIQTARLLRDTYEIPVIFLTSYSDDETISRAAREMPYGYLAKPFQSRELKATLQVALHRAKVEAGLRAAHRKIAATFKGMHDALLMVSLTGDIQFMNAASERPPSQAAEGANEEADTFDLVSVPMVQLDGNGHILRVNQALMRESGVAAESLIGRTLKGLSMDPDPRISKQLLRRLLDGDLTVPTAAPRDRAQGVFTSSGGAPEIPGSHRTGQ
ncbi:MAG: response regulator [Terracidiphilus sp.]